MLNSKKMITALASSLCLMSTLVAPTVQASLMTYTPDTLVSVSVDGDANTTGAVNGGPLVNNDVIVRERKDTAQEGLRIATFLDFDLSALTTSMVNNAAFSSVFEIDFVTRLNTKNNLSVLIGQVEETWSDVSGSLPEYEWAETSNDQSVVVNNIRTDAFDTYSVDVTNIVKDWVNGVSENYGFVLFASNTQFQGAGLNNPSLIVNVPAPSTVAIFGLALVGFSLSRKVKR